MTRTAKTYGVWNVTQAERDAAIEAADGMGQEGEDAYQLVRYCRGDIFHRDLAIRALQRIRASAP